MYRTEFKAINAELLDHNQKQVVLDEPMLTAMEELMQVRCPSLVGRNPKPPSPPQPRGDPLQSGQRQAAFYLLVSCYTPDSLQTVFLMRSPQQANKICTKEGSDAYLRSHNLQARSRVPCKKGWFKKYFFLLRVHN